MMPAALPALPAVGGANREALVPPVGDNVKLGGIPEIAFIYEPACVMFMRYQSLSLSLKS